MLRREVSAWPPERTATRVLIEDPDGGSRVIFEQALRSSGYEVASCGGPRELPGGRCPLRRGNECVLVAGADVIYTNLDWHDHRCCDVLRSLVQQHADIPIVVAATAPARQVIEPFIDGCTVTHPPRRRTDVVAAVAQVLG